MLKIFYRLIALELNYVAQIFVFILFCYFNFVLLWFVCFHVKARNPGTQSSVLFGSVVVVRDKIASRSFQIYAMRQ